MSKMYLFYPINNVIDPSNVKIEARLAAYDREANAFERGAAEVFEANGNPEEQIIKSIVNVSWSKTPPSRDALTPTAMTANPDIIAAKKAVWADDHDKTTTKYYGSVGKSSLLTSFRAGRGHRAVLGALTSSDVLFVVGHGSYRGDYLTHEETWSKHEHYYCLRADALANILMHNGLKKSHAFIKMNMCFGGGAAGVGATYAKSVATELGARGYHNVLVGGYQYGIVHRTPNLALSGFEYRNGKAQFVYIKGGELKQPYAARNNPASALLMYDQDPYRCWYNAKGSTVRWNEAETDFVPAHIMDRNDPAFAQLARQVYDAMIWENELNDRRLG
jgi:hypothetical protein